MKGFETKIANSVHMGQILEFEVAFPNEERLPIEQYLAGSSREMILTASTFFLSFNNHNSKFNDNRDFLGMFFCAENNELANRIYNRIKEIEKKGVRVGIINTYSSLSLFEYCFSKVEGPETQLQAELEVNLFKAYLALNSEFATKQNVAIPTAKCSDKELNVPMMMFCMYYPVSDKTNYDLNQIWTTQMIKSIYLFQFLESEKMIQPLLVAFNNYFNCQMWQDYLKKLLTLILPALKNEKETHTDIIVEQGELFEENCAFIEKLIILEKDEIDQNDFLTIRAKPFYKVKDGVYRVIFKLFVVEKIFKGVYFILRDLNKSLPEAHKIREFRSFYGHKFSEKILCYRVMESIYSNSCIRFSGQDLADRNIVAAPDYYIRKGNNILIVESKDFLIAAEKKMSFNFNVYEEEFGKSLDFEQIPNGKIKPKAVLQLVNNIRRILKTEFHADTDYHYKNVFIYPVLLTHDHQYDTSGFNELINFWFQDELSILADEGLFIHQVKPLSVVNIDSIIYNQVVLANDISLHKILNKYHESKIFEKWENWEKRNFKSKSEYDNCFENYKSMRMTKLIPFSMFIDNYIHDHFSWKQPPLIDILAPVLFNVEKR